MFGIFFVLISIKEILIGSFCCFHILKRKGTQFSVKSHGKNFDCKGNKLSNGAVNAIA